MTHGSRREFLLHLGELLCATERQRHAASSQPIQSSQQSTIESKVAAFLTGKEPLADFFRKIKLEISVATAEHTCVDYVPNLCINLACHCQTKL